MQASFRELGMPETGFPRRWLLGNLVYGSGVRVGRPSASALCAVRHRLLFVVSVNLNHTYGLAILPPPTQSPARPIRRGSLHPGSFVALKLSGFREYPFSAAR